MTTRAALLTQSKQFPPGSRSRKAVILRYELRKATTAELKPKYRRQAKQRKWKQ